MGFINSASRRKYTRRRGKSKVTPDSRITREGVLEARGGGERDRINMTILTEGKEKKAMGVAPAIGETCRHEAGLLVRTILLLGGERKREGGR